MESPLHSGAKSITYEQAIQLIEKHLNQVPDQNIRQWAKDNDIHYNTLIALINHTTPNDIPGFVKNVLEKLGFEVETQKRVTYRLKKKDKKH